MFLVVKSGFDEHRSDDATAFRFHRLAPSIAWLDGDSCSIGRPKAVDLTTYMPGNRTYHVQPGDKRQAASTSHAVAL